MKSFVLVSVVFLIVSAVQHVHDVHDVVQKGMLAMKVDANGNAKTQISDETPQAEVAESDEEDAGGEESSETALVAMKDAGGEDAGGEESDEEEHAMCSETALGSLCRCGMQCEANADCAKIKAKNCGADDAAMGATARGCAAAVSGTADCVDDPCNKCLDQYLKYQCTKYAEAGTSESLRELKANKTGSRQLPDTVDSDDSDSGMDSLGFGGLGFAAPDDADLDAMFPASGGNSDCKGAFEAAAAADLRSALARMHRKVSSSKGGVSLDESLTGKRSC